MQQGKAPQFGACAGKQPPSTSKMCTAFPFHIAVLPRQLSEVTGPHIDYGAKFQSMTRLASTHSPNQESGRKSGARRSMPPPASIRAGPANPPRARGRLIRHKPLNAVKAAPEQTGNDPHETSLLGSGDTHRNTKNSEQTQELATAAKKSGGRASRDNGNRLERAIAWRASPAPRRRGGKIQTEFRTILRISRGRMPRGNGRPACRRDGRSINHDQNRVAKL
jgi:hypothetical protein